MTREEIHHVIRFFKKLFILAALLFVLDRGLGLFFQYLYERKPPPDIQAFNHVMNTPLEDVYIFGSSKAVHGYVSNVFADTLGLTCFNAGREQTNILYADIVMSEMLRKHAPKLVILDITAKETVAHNMEASKLILASLMIPHINTDTSFLRIGKALFPKEVFAARLSVLQRYNSQVLPLLTGARKNRFEENGYLPVHGSKVEGDMPAFQDKGESYDTTAKNYFEHFVTMLQAKHVKLIVIQSPYYVQKFTTSPSLDALMPIIKKYNVEYLDYSFNPEFFKKDYFYDNVHLNDKGAPIFSARLASDLRKDFEKNDTALLSKLQSHE
ncbi:hypothetical protein [Parafilimonas sp.]|uniref:hypothetical protein n=1 Tax=Parafilimonas sp. TaxID=1969739 RepID=UPI0039E53ADA